MNAYTENLLYDCEERVSLDFARLEELLPPLRRANIKLPAGVVRSVKKIIPDFRFIGDETLRHNICYAVVALDFYEWILGRFYTFGPVKSYLVKTSIILADMVVEAMTRDFVHRKCIKPAKKHSKNICKLERLGVPKPLVKSVRALHSRRSNIHLHLVSDLEAEKYNERDWYLSLKCLYDAKKKFEELLRS